MSSGSCLRLAGVVALAVLAQAALAQPLDRTLMVAPTQEIAGEARNALVIGNSAYGQGPLRNPVNDARAMAKALGETGFHVILLENASEATMQRAIRAFGQRIAKGGVGLFYYAGHGLQVKGRNYLVPVNADIAHEDEVEFSAVDVNQVLAKMDTAKNGLNIVILDACRNNPFQRSFRSMQTGLAQMDAPTGTFIAFATAPGSVAADGAGDNGIYTQHLLGELAKPGLPIEQLFKQVRNGVMAATKGQQIPWESSSLRGDFAFRRSKPQPSVEDVVAEALKREREAHQREREAQRAAMETQRLEMEKVLQAALAEQRKKLDELGMRPPPPPKPVPLDPAALELAFWDSVKASPEAEDYRAYLEQYPGGKFAPLAKARIAAIERRLASAPAKEMPVVTASLAPAPAPTPIPAMRNRMPQAGDSWTYRLTEAKRRDGPKQRTYRAWVSASSASGILEEYTLDEAPSGRWAHVTGPYVVGVGVSVFSPFLAAFEDLRPGMSLSRVAINDPSCGGLYDCQASAKVVGRETVTVPAGTYEAVKVQVEHSWAARMMSGHQSSLLNGARHLTIWYVPALKRAVKFSSRLDFGDTAPVDADFDLELLSFKVN